MTATPNQPRPTPEAQPDAAEEVYAERPRGERRSRTAVWVVFGALLLLLVGAGAAWALLRGAEADAEEPAAEETPTTAVSEEGLAAYDADGDGIVYQSGMHPWHVQDEPGQCPVCGMDLQPVAVGGGEAGTVAIDPVTMQNIGVRTAPVEIRSVTRDLRATGVFQASDRARTAVSLKIGGWVEDLYVDAEGDRVQAGAPLLALYSPELVATQEEYLLALRNRDLLGGTEGDRLVDAARRRLSLFDISGEQIDRLEATGEVQRRLTIYSPAGGTVVDKDVVEGMQVAPGRTLMEIVDLGQLWLQIDVPEQDLGWVDAGTAAVVRVESRPGEELRGRVDYIYDTLDPATRTGTARVVVPNPGRYLKPGMYATARLAGDPTAPRPTVPTEAVIRTGDEAVVILALGEGRFQPQPVTLGVEAGGYVQILDGLRGSEVVVTSAQFLIDSEARLAAAIGSMTGGAAMEDGEPMDVDHSQMNH